MNMSAPRYCVANLPKAKETFDSIFLKVKSVYGEKAMTASQIYRIIKLVKEGKRTKDKRKQNSKKMARTGDFLASVAAAAENFAM